MNHYDWHLKEQLMGTSLPPQLLGSPHLIQNRGASNRIPLPLPLPPSLPFPAPWLQWTCKKTQHSLNSLNRLWLTAERSEIQHTKWKEAYLICLGGCQIIRYDRNRWPRRTAWSSNTSSCLAETKKNISSRKWLSEKGYSFKKHRTLFCHKTWRLCKSDVTDSDTLDHFSFVYSSNTVESLTQLINKQHES